jgi:tetratricopeptide (TPR) repeat protein
MRAALLVLVAMAAPAFAQSRRYPPEPPDPDRDAEEHSKLWEDALSPGRTPYQALVTDSKHLADLKTADATKDALAKLDKAVALLPREPDAYAARGELYLAQKQWDKCADDFQAAEDRSPPDDGKTPERTQRRVSLGICQARAGRFADAERTLVGASATTNARASTWLRLGEVRIAMGKLEEAVGALDTALEMCSAGCDAPVGLVHFLLASAYDRGRRPGDASGQIDEGSKWDRSFGSIQAPTYPLLGPGEPDYLLGLAHRYEPTPRLEYALVHFRRFLKMAPDSPWRRRAEEHVRELSALDLPLAVERRAGTTTPDLDAARAAVVKVMPQMRACLAKLPTTVLEVQITRDGPHTPDSVRDRPRFRTPPAGASVRDSYEPDIVVRADVDAAVRCVQPLAERIAMPAVKDRDTYYIVAFLVSGS